MTGTDFLINPAIQPVVTNLMKGLPQGLLLTGDEGVGLRTLALALAHGQTKNIFEIAPEKGVITIEKIRELYGVAKTNTGRGVILIDDADAMGREASNALLKLLEEPGANLRFILTSHFPDALLPTITSRVQTVNVPRVSAAQSAALLDSLGATDTTKRSQLMFIAGGLSALMTRLASDDTAFGTRAKTVRDARQFLSASREERLVVAASYGSDRSAAIGLVRDMMKLVRLSLKSSANETGITTIETLITAERDLTENSSVRLTLTYAALTV